MKESIGRVNAMILRYVYLHRRSLPRAFEIFFWPVMELFVWGFVSVYLQSISANTLSRIAVAMINGMIFWDILYRSQQGVSISFIEDIWTQNIVNLLVSPLKISEWILATFIYGMLKTLLITTILATLAFFLYHFNLVHEMALYLVPLMLNLLLFGWVVGVLTASLIIRWGHAAEALIWGVPFLIQPVSAVFYPLSVLPPWLQAVSKALPSTYVFEGMRAVLLTHTFPKGYFLSGLLLNLVYFVISGFFFNWMFRQAQRTGRLGRLGMD